MPCPATVAYRLAQGEKLSQSVVDTTEGVKTVGAALISWGATQQRARVCSRRNMGSAHAARTQDTGAKECGLHSGNMVAAAAAQAAGEEQRDLWVGGAVEALDKGQLQALLAGSRERHTLVVFYAPWCPFSQACAHRLGPGKYLGRRELERWLQRAYVTHHAYSEM